MKTRGNDGTERYKKEEKQEKHEDRDRKIKLRRQRDAEDKELRIRVGAALKMHASPFGRGGKFPSRKKAVGENINAWSV